MAQPNAFICTGNDHPMIAHNVTTTQHRKSNITGFSRADDVSTAAIGHRCQIDTPSNCIHPDIAKIRMLSYPATTRQPRVAVTSRQIA